MEKGANHNFSNLFCEHGLLVALQIRYIAQEKQLPSFLTKSYSSILKKTKVFHYRKILQNLLRQKKHSLGTTRLDGPFFNQKNSAAPFITVTCKFRLKQAQHYRIGNAVMRTDND